MIRSVIQATFDFFYPPMKVEPLTGAAALANAIRCAEEDVAFWRREYVVRRKQLGYRCPFLGRQVQSTAFRLYNAALRELKKAEAALAALQPRH